MGSGSFHTILGLCFFKERTHLFRAFNYEPNDYGTSNLDRMIIGLRSN